MTRNVMTINPALLIAAPILQDSFVDKSGLPMAGGTITCYHDNSRTTLKNWYYQTGTPGNYTYTPLPNPLTLSSAGTITDINGVDTIPFFYPFLESDETIIDRYYITIVNYSQTNQITRANFPYNIEINNPTEIVPTFDNLIINNGFWRNVQPNTTTDIPPTTITLSSGGTSTFLALNLYGNQAGIVSPSQHDGFSMPDVQFIKNNLSANDNCTFVPFPLQGELTVPDTNTPEYYIAHNCTTIGLDETLKVYQFPISLHINNLADLNYTVSIIASSSTSSQLELHLYQFTGTTVAGTASPAPTRIAQTTLQLTSTFKQYSLTDIFPPAEGLNLSIAGDDAFYLQVSLPLNQLCNINFTKPSLYLTNNAIPEFDYQSYDVVNSIISSPRTGDIRMALNLYGSPLGQTIEGGTGIGSMGWVYANDPTSPTIGSSASGANSRANNDTWLLYYLIWTHTLAAVCPVIGAPGGRGTTAFSDFSLNRPIQLPLQLGLLMGSAGAGNAPLPPRSLGQSDVFAVGAGGGEAGSVYYNVFLKL